MVGRSSPSFLLLRLHACRPPPTTTSHVVPASAQPDARCQIPPERFHPNSKITHWPAGRRLLLYQLFCSCHLSTLRRRRRRLTTRPPYKVACRAIQACLSSTFWLVHDFGTWIPPLPLAVSARLEYGQDAQTVITTSISTSTWSAHVCRATCASHQSTCSSGQNHVRSTSPPPSPLQLSSSHMREPSE